MIGGRVPPWWRRVAFAGTKQVYHARPKPVIYIVPAQLILGRLALVPVGDSMASMGRFPTPCTQIHLPSYGASATKGVGLAREASSLGFDMAVRPSAPHEGELLA